MPHSSGGGSSSHGSHGSSRNETSEMRYGNKYYRGSNRYVYYLDGTPQYYYSDRPFTVQGAKSEQLKKIFWSFIYAIVSIVFGFSGIRSFPQKITLDYNTDIVIIDSAQILSEAETTEMEKAFLTFQDKTGVTPAFFTIMDTELEEQGGDLRDYAYRLYVNTFADEKHWLVVYCIDDQGEHWSWEGMIGDDCESIISTDLENEFTQKLHNDLENHPEMLTASVINAFETIGKKTGKIPFAEILWAGGLFLLAAFFIFGAVKKIINMKKVNIAEDPRINSVQCPTAETEPETIECQYCGGTFVAGLHTNCPHCGAPIETWE